MTRTRCRRSYVFCNGNLVSSGEFCCQDCQGVPARPVVPNCLVEGGGDAAALSPDCPDQLYLDVADLEKPTFRDGYTWKIVGGAALEHEGQLLTLNGRGKSEDSRGQHLTVDGGTTFGGGAMSFCARVKYDAMQSYSRIFDFGKGMEDDNIYLCNNRDSQDLKFSVRRGSDSHDVKVRNFFQPNEWVHVCATVDADGVMRIIKDGTEVKCTRYVFLFSCFPVFVFVCPRRPIEIQCVDSVCLIK